jgi:hypothetical protein
VLSRGFPIGVALAAALYLLLIDTLSSPELYAGAGAVLVAGGISELARRTGLRGGSVAPGPVGRVPRALLRVPADIWWLSVEALAQLITPRAQRGVMRTVPFQHGEMTDGNAMTRRALAEGMGSIAPNAIVIGIDPERNLLLAHQLRRSGPAESLDPLGLG